MRITSKGQVTIPQAIREKFGFLPETEVEFVVEGNAVKIVRAKKGKALSRGQAIVARIRGTATGKMTTDEIMALTRGE
ncbi:MAG: AbrB/MazE/SpoVT family DNA-binding domain-containing protein [Deltaproteobacteria bacterium]|nr:AbrB/MazE/SpoVT family DNA-binding domain-containing protein [Deltaproteobacteria bacterium]